MNTYGISMKINPCGCNPNLIGEMPGGRHFAVTLTRPGSKPMRIYYSVGSG